MKCEIEIGRGVDCLIFGLTRTEVRMLIDSQVDSRKRNQSDSSYDYFIGLGIFMYYDAEDKLEAIEITKPAKPQLSLVSLLELSFVSAKKLLLSLSENVREDGAGATAEDLGIGVYAPFAKKDPKALIEAVIVFGHGYYDT